MTLARLALLLLIACNDAKPTASKASPKPAPVTSGDRKPAAKPAPSAAVPADVRKTVDALLGPSAVITSEREGNATIYEGAIQTKLEVEVSDKGKLLTTEIELPVKALPAAVVAAVKGPISEAEVVVTEKALLFSVETDDNEYLIDASGKIVGREKEADKPGQDGD